MSGEGSAESAGSRTTANKKIHKTKLLLGEGVDEQRFFEAMLKHLGKEDTQALPYDGKSKLSGVLKVLMADPKWPDVEAVLITRDADFPRDRAAESAAQSAWRTVTDILRSQGLPVPRAHGELVAGSNGSTGAALRVGVFILPDGKRDGMLEDLCLDAIAGDPAKPCLDAYLRCIEEGGITIARNVLPKARAHAFLASRPVPDKRVGEAAIEGYWPWEAAALAPLLSFVRSA